MAFRAVCAIIFIAASENRKNSYSVDPSIVDASDSMLSEFYADVTDVARVHCICSSLHCISDDFKCIGLTHVAYLLGLCSKDDTSLIEVLPEKSNSYFQFFPLWVGDAVPLA